MHVPYHEHSAPTLGVYWSHDAAAYYRVAVPLGAIGGVMAPFHAMRQSQVRNAQVAIVTRYGAQRDSRPEDAAALAGALKEHAGRLIVDFDDDLAGQPARYRSPARNIAAVEAIARQADAITCTNVTLAGRLRHLGRDVRVLPNYVRPEDWPTPTPADGPLTLVLAGSYTHADDWRIVAPAIARLRRDHGARLRVCGFLPDYLRALCDDFRPWAGLDAYPAMLAGAHIGLCPLPDSGFNRCKSPIKLYEYALAGLAVVASPCQYGPVLRAAGQAEHIAPDGGDWYGAILRLLDNPAPAAAHLRRHVIAHHDARQHAATITAAYAA